MLSSVQEEYYRIQIKLYKEVQRKRFQRKMYQWAYIAIFVVAAITHL